MKFLIACAALAAFAVTPVFAHEETGAPAKAEVKKETPEQKKDAKESEAPKHSGGTDSNGCHTNHQTGEYHCHNPR